MKSAIYFVVALTLSPIVSGAQHHPQPPPDALTTFTEPGGTPGDVQLATSDPDEYAWHLFFFLNRQAGNKAGQPDMATPTFQTYAADKAVVWETWALANQNDNSEVFSCPPKRPVPWDALARSVPSDKRQAFSVNLSNVAVNPPRRPAGRPSRGRARTSEILEDSLPPSPDIANVEVRMNRAEYEAIIDNTLWNQEGILAKATQAHNTNNATFIEFPKAAKAIKARWIPLPEVNGQYPDKARYHWRSTKSFDGTTVIWGLAALHIMTRDLTHWFWVDFTHADCLSGTAPCSGMASVGTVKASDSTTVSSNGQRAETVGTKWQNYRLMGTETDFMRGSTPQHLTDPLIESDTASSCITCHAYAATETQAGFAGPHHTDPRLVTPDFTKYNLLGTPDNMYCGTSSSCSAGAAPVYFQSSFAWSMLRNANSSSSTCETHTHQGIFSVAR